MKIERVEAVSLSVSSRTLSTSYGASVPRRTHAFVRVITDQGQFGIGEASPLPHFTGEVGETIAWIINERLAPPLIGLDPFDVERIHQLLDKALPLHMTAKHALITAVYDLLGKVIARPAGVFLGGRLRDAFPVVGAIGIADIDVAVAAAIDAVESGSKTLKLKIGVTTKQDRESVAAVRQAVGNDIEIRVDANQKYDVKEAIQLVRALEPLNIQYVEQPVRSGDPRDIAQVTAATDVRIAADESVYGPTEALTLLRKRAADVFIIKLIKVGGLYRARQLLAMAEAANIPCVLVSPYETTVGTAANLHVAAAAPNVPFAIEVSVFDIPDDPGRGIDMHDGIVHVPTGPGLGVTVDDRLFQSFAD